MICRSLYKGTCTSTIAAEDCLRVVSLRLGEDRGLDTSALVGHEYV